MQYRVLCDFAGSDDTIIHRCMSKSKSYTGATTWNKILPQSVFASSDYVLPFEERIEADDLDVFKCMSHLSIAGKLEFHDSYLYTDLSSQTLLVSSQQKEI